jgi:hypothetical protein
MRSALLVLLVALIMGGASFLGASAQVDSSRVPEALYAAQESVADAHSDYIIEPGKRVNGFIIGEATGADIIKQLGMTDLSKMKEVAKGRYVSVCDMGWGEFESSGREQYIKAHGNTLPALSLAYYDKYADVYSAAPLQPIASLTFYFDTGTSRIQYIEVEVSDGNKIQFKTPEGVNFASREGDVLKAYGYPQDLSGSEYVGRKMSYYDKGISFTVGEDVSSILVYKPVSMKKDTLIVPGRSVSGFILGETSWEEVKKAFGKTEQSDWEKELAVLGAEKYIQKKGAGFEIELFDEQRLTFFIDLRTMKIIGINVRNYCYHTAEGIRVGSTEEDVLRVFGKSDDSSAPLKGWKSYGKMGLHFSVENGRVVEIGVSLPKKS